MSTTAETFDDFCTKVLQNLGFRGVRVKIHCAPPFGWVIGIGVLGVGSGVGLGVARWFGVVWCWVTCWVGWVGREKVKKSTTHKDKKNEKKNKT